jgi:hypothetical protein
MSARHRPRGRQASSCATASHAWAPSNLHGLPEPVDSRLMMASSMCLIFILTSRK